MCKNCNYVALHNHSHYSLLDGYATIDEYIQAAKDNGMIGIGLADHGTASGLYKFITRVKKAGLIPVPGIEFYVAPENPEGAKRKAPVYYGRGGQRAPKYDVPGNGAYLHLTVFAYNNKGLENLFKLTSLSWKQEHFYLQPRIDTNMLAEHSEGLIVTTGCPSSEVNRRFLLGQDDKAYEYASRLKSIFGDNMYVEVMNHEMEDDELERILMPKLIKLSRDLDIPMIATNDSHYAFKKDAEPHERVLSIQTKTPMTVPAFHEGGTRFAFSGPEYYIKSYDEMYSVYPEDIAKEALENTIELTKKCEGITLEYDPHLRPEIEIPDGMTSPEYLQVLITEGFNKKRGHESDEVKQESIKRIREEFAVIHSNDFIDYFLVVHDYIDFAHKNNIGVGAGRGSIGGSEIAYVLDISNTDPIKYDLLFERFLSPGRGSQYQIDYADGSSEVVSVSEKREVYYADGTSKVVYIHELEPGDLINYKDGKDVIKNIFVKVPGSAPDVDTDFHTEGRDEVIEYVTEKYGKENVAHIVTFGTFKAKRAFKAMCTAYRVPFALANKASDAIPNPEEGVDVTLADLMDPTSARYNEGADFRQLTEGEQWNEIIEMAIPLNGRISETGVHPCGIIISNQPLAGIIPTQVRQSDNKLVTQWEYPELEALGLIKMDFLGLELINTIQQTVENIKLTNESVDEKYKREVPNMREIVMGDMDDPATYKNLQKGHTIGVFQLGSPGVRELLRRAKPTQFMDIATITALYRPGPMSTNAHLEWADRKNGVKEVEYIDPGFKGTVVQEILEDTSGILVFQEQLMQIVTRYAGMSSYEADTLRKAMGKKKMDIMVSLKPKFIEGAIKNGSTKQLAEKLWDTMEGFAQYGFNKSHSVSYAINIYQTIYLKTHYPSEFMAALIQQGFGNPSKVAEFLQEAQRMGLRVGPVDINGSQVKMAATGKGNDDKYDIVYGFAGVKQVNETLSQEIVNERLKNGPYKSVADFVKRITKRTQINSGALSSLALAGAFDSFGVSRKLVSEKAGMIIQSGTRKASKGVSLFDLGGVAKENDVTEAIEVHGEDYSYNERIKLEADRIGLFVSGHPTARLGHIAVRYKATPLSKVKQNTTKETFTVLGTVTQLATRVNRSGRRSIAIMIDDGSDTAATYLPRNIVQSIEKGEELERIRKAHAEGKQLRQTKRSEQLMELVNDDTIEPMESIELNEVYRFKVQMRGFGSNAKVAVQEIERLETAHDGSLPYEVKVVNQAAIEMIERVALKHKDDNGTYILMHFNDGTYEYVKTRVKLNIDFIMDIEKVVGSNNIITNDI